MAIKDSLGDRMKRYEAASKTVLTRRMPCVIRLDGKSFHSFTKKVKAVRPFCDRLHGVMMTTASALLEQIHGAKVVYTQSDELTVLLTDYDQLQTDAWFDYEVQKMCSIASAIATAAFNKAGGYDHTALFDARVFNVPKEDVVNNFLWRQQDATRNSVSMYAQSMFSSKELHGKNTAQKKQMMQMLNGFSWGHAPTWTQRGACVYRGQVQRGETLRSVIVHDNEIPLFNEDRGFLERFVYLEGT